MSSPTVPEALRTFVSSLPDPAIVVDGHLKILHLNDAYLRLSGLKPREISVRLEKGLKCTDLLALDICEGSCAVRACISRRGVVNLHEVGGRTGARRSEPTTFLVTSFPVALTDGEGAVEVYRDVTAERRVQERFQGLLESERRHSEELEGLVKARTQELEKSLRDLERAKDQLVQSEKLSSLGQLVAGIAHELNNPINFIYGNTTFLLQYVNALLSLVDVAMGLGSLSEGDRTKLSAAAKEADLEFVREDARKLVSSVRTGAERTAQIVKGLRVFARAGQTEYEDADIAECLEATAIVLAHLFKGDVRLVKRIEAIGRVRCNSSQINQVFMNLIKNARDAINGKGEVTVELASAGDYVIARVSDTGQGIAPDNLSRIFDPFFTTKPVGQGQGLGLSIAYSIVQAHAGTIEVVSTVGKGTAFTVRLPKKGPPTKAGEPRATADAQHRKVATGVQMPDKNPQ